MSDRGAPRLPHERHLPFEARWAIRRANADETEGASTLAAAPADGWIDIPAPTTAAAALRAVGEWSIDGPAQRFDADDWWFRAGFDLTAEVGHGATPELFFGGLAGRCDVWLNGEALLSSCNMHLAHRRLLPACRRTGNELLMRFASLDLELARRRPRPRWRAPMVEHQQLRWMRTTLLGRTPGWSPPAAPVGPWRAVAWVAPAPIVASNRRLVTRLDGACGCVDLTIDLDTTRSSANAAQRIDRAELTLTRGGAIHRAALPRDERHALRFSAAVRVPNAALWWPHTHGEPALYDAHIEIHLAGDAAPVRIALGRIGFRTIAMDTTGGDFALSVNGVPVFCRGACWTPLDPVSLQSSLDACRDALDQVRAAGLNMLRVSGSMVYEEDHFYDACDALGILVWQDFMFANMDYPEADAEFAASVRAEAEQQLQRWQARPALAVVCGNSEVAQQAAMWGAPREAWSQPLFERDLAELTEAACPGVPYWPSSAHGGAFPHRNDTGTTAYYGVGAYRQPLADARRSGLRFATECLAFANMPDDATLARMPGASALRVNHPGWKARSPRDLGAGWDFDDVRDHYLQALYRVDPVALRSTDHRRFLALSRAVGAEVMSAAFGEWRRGASSCRGALVWFLRDLWAGAGWGLLDDQGAPKAAFHGLRRACAPIAIFISDEGTNGLDLHVANDPAAMLDAQIEVAVYRDDGLRLECATQSHRVAGHGTLALPVAAWFDHFTDLSRAYRFGPAGHALVVATLRSASGVQLGQAFHFAEGLPAEPEQDVGLSAHAEPLGDGCIALVIESRRFAQSIDLDLPGFEPDDAYFHLAPGGRRSVRLTPRSVAAVSPALGSIGALNSRTRERVALR